jgi:hypothetical protein
MVAKVGATRQTGHAAGLEAPSDRPVIPQPPCPSVPSAGACTTTASPSSSHHIRRGSTRSSARSGPPPSGAPPSCLRSCCPRSRSSRRGRQGTRGPPARHPGAVWRRSPRSHSSRARRRSRAESASLRRERQPRSTSQPDRRRTRRSRLRLAGGRRPSPARPRPARPPRPDLRRSGGPYGARPTTGSSIVLRRRHGAPSSARVLPGRCTRWSTRLQNTATRAARRFFRPTRRQATRAPRSSSPARSR